jgi:hypothetical protein
MRFISDGSYQSIAPAFFTQAEDAPIKANITWITIALRQTFGGHYSFVNLPPVYPGAVNSLLWWTTGNMQVSNPSFFEAGMVFGYSRA